MHAPAPLRTRSLAATGNTNLKVATYESFLQSGQSFLRRFGAGLRAKIEARDFSQALIAIHFNSGSAKTGGRDGYAKLVEDAINMVKRRLQCPAA